MIFEPGRSLLALTKLESWKQGRVRRIDASNSPDRVFEDVAVAFDAL